MPVAAILILIGSLLRSAFLNSDQNEDQPRLRITLSESGPIAETKARIQGRVSLPTSDRISLDHSSSSDSSESHRSSSGRGDADRDLRPTSGGGRGGGGNASGEQDDAVGGTASDGSDPPGDIAERHGSPLPPQRPLLYNWVPDGTPMVLLREVNAQAYVIVYQDILPDSDRAIGVADPRIVVGHLERVLSSSFSGWGVLDFENQFFTNLALAPGDPDHERTVDSLLATLQAIRSRWPESKWTVWGVPDIGFWIHESGEEPLSWATADFDRANRVGRAIVASHQRLVDHLDWISPWVYDLYAFNASAGAAQRNRMEAQIAWSRAKIRFSRELVAARPGGAIPLIPMLCPSFAPGGDAEIPSIVPTVEFQQESLQPIMPMGVDGLALWTQFGFRMTQAFRIPENDHQHQLREASRQWLRQILERAYIAPIPFDHPNGRAWWNDKLRTILFDRIRLMDEALRQHSP